MKLRFPQTAAAVLFATTFAAPAIAAEAITTCGQILNGDGYLTGDLDCSGDAGSGATVTFTKKATLDLAGFTLTGRPNDIVTMPDGGHYGATVQCTGRCAINGPGTIVGGSTSESAVVSFGPYWQGRRIEITNVTLTGGAYGAIANRLELHDVTITGNRTAGAWGERAEIVNSTITDNGEIGVQNYRTATVIGSTISGHGNAGIQFSKSITLVDSDVSGNDVDPGCAISPFPCADLKATKSVSVSADSSCGSSAKLDRHDGSPTGETWGVCTND